MRREIGPIHERAQESKTMFYEKNPLVFLQRRQDILDIFVFFPPKSSWWFQTPMKNMLVKVDHFPK